MSIIERSFGRRAFGDNAAGYHAARPAYRDEVWSALRQRAGLRPGIDILEIGAGTGMATAQLLEHEPAGLLAIEPDPRLAGFLRETLSDPRLQVLIEPFEYATLPAAGFDLAVSATAFHWLDAVPALRRLADMLRPGGHVALWWHVFGDHIRPDPFHLATAHLFAGHQTSRSNIPDRPPHALDRRARLADFAAAGFLADPPETTDWELILDPAGMRALYSTYSNVTALPDDERETLLDALTAIATERFGGRVVRNMTTAIYTARRPD
nr:class I SAM-dependent methyltransferase [uncultured Devosia sp.]